MEILPFIEETALFDQFDLKKTALNQSTTTRPEEKQPPILLCPSDSARDRFYVNSGRRFAKGNYVCFVGPEHSVSMRCFPGAMINEPQPLKRFVDGLTKTLMLTEVRTRDDQDDERGVWAIGLNGGSIISFDMHSSTAGTSPCEALKRNMPYIPFDVATPPLPPNSPPYEENADGLRGCADNSVTQRTSTMDLMPCRHQTNDTWVSAAPRSNHPGGVNATNCDGSIVFLANDIDRFLMSRLISINDGQLPVEGK